MEAKDLRRRILIVDDEEINRAILGNILEDHYDVSFAENGQQAYEMLHERMAMYSLILLDLLMPVMDGFELIDKLKKEEGTHGIPIIVMTSEEGAEVKSIKLGAADFITKPYDMPEIILARCERIIELYEDKTLISAAEHDNLTGLYSREFFYEYIRQREQYDSERQVDAVVLNIGHFHMINEMYGRDVGDDVLKKTSVILNRLFEDKSCIGCRLDGDIFFYYVDHSDNYEEIFAGFTDELERMTHVQRIRFRIGIYQNVDKKLSAEDWFDHAKLACDSIRGDYTRQLCYYNMEQNRRELYQERLINDMEASIKNHDFMVYYQPKFDIRGEEPKFNSAEALIRWKHPELGMISPGDFVPIFESNGLIQKLDQFVWQEVASQIRKWKDEYGVSVPVSVNVSRVDINDPELQVKLQSLLERNGITTSDIMLEITESAYSENAEVLITVVNDLRAMGFTIEMDDFGSGYSSLNMLTTIPIDVLKVDMKFIRNMNKDAKSLKLVELVLDIAKFLGVPAIAEGVEDDSQLNKLREMGCDIIQGYYFSKPVPPEEFVRFIK